MLTLLTLTRREEDFYYGFNQIIERWNNIFGGAINYEITKQPDMCHNAGKHVIRCIVWFDNLGDEKEDFPVPNNQSGWTQGVAVQEGREAALELLKRYHKGDVVKFIQNYLLYKIV